MEIGNSLIILLHTQAQYAQLCLLSVSGIMFNTGKGQHILKNPLIVNGIIEKVGCTGTDDVQDRSIL